MPITSRGAGGTGARFNLSGTISSGASWIETYTFQVAGGIVHADADIWDWQFNFRKDYGSGPDLSLTTGTELTVTNSSEATSFAIAVGPDDLASMEGDYIADIAYEDADGNRIHWAHGIVTFRNEPIWSS